MTYITVTQAAERWGKSPQRVRVVLDTGRIPGAIKPGHDWLIPADAEWPQDNRYSTNKKRGGV